MLKLYLTRYLGSNMLFANKNIISIKYNIIYMYVALYICHYSYYLLIKHYYFIELYVIVIVFNIKYTLYPP